MDDTPRARSPEENLNSRLRKYFFLRRHLSEGCLSLLQYRTPRRNAALRRGRILLACAARKPCKLNHARRADDSSLGCKRLT